MHNDSSQVTEPGSPRAGAGIRHAWAAWGAAGVFVVVIGTTVFWRWHHPHPATTVQSNPVEMDQEPVVEPPGYLGSQACAGCHADRVAEFEKTNHFRTLRVPRADMLPIGFTPGQGTVMTPDPALRFEMTREGHALFQTTIRKSSLGEERMSTPIDLILGAGTADDVYLSWRPDGRIYELPVAWLHTSSQWGTSNFDPYGAGDYSRELNPRCMECHSTWLHHVPGTANQYQREHALLGVSCERCHGPASEHVAWHRRHPEAEPEGVIVQPARLTRELQLDVCTQCHSNAMKRRGAAFSYRPGQPLEASFKILKTKHNEQDHVANQIQYLRQSKCFQTGDSLTCTTCHDPHRARGPTDSRSAQESCLKCHQASHCREQDRLPASVRENCTGCHMPSYVKMNVTFTTKDDANLPPMLRFEHRIGIYPGARDKVLLDWYRTQADTHSREAASRLSTGLVEHWLAQAIDFQSQHRPLAVIGAYREALRVDDTQALRDKLHRATAAQARLDSEYSKALHEIEERRFPAAIETLEALLRMKPDLAKAHGRLGTAYAAVGEKDLAVEHLRAVARHDPDDSYGESMLGWLAYVDGHHEDAVEHLQRADDVEPYNAKINFHAGLALAALNRRVEAIERFRRVLQIDPKHAEACYRLGVALVEQGTPEEALPFARRSALLTREQNLDALLGLARAYFEADRHLEARATLVRALALAQEKAPARVSELKARINQIKSQAADAK